MWCPLIRKAQLNYPPESRVHWVTLRQAFPLFLCQPNPPNKDCGDGQLACKPLCIFVTLHSKDWPIFESAKVYADVLTAKPSSASKKIGQGSKVLRDFLYIFRLPFDSVRAREEYCSSTSTAKDDVRLFSFMCWESRQCHGDMEAKQKLQGRFLPWTGTRGKKNHRNLSEKAGNKYNKQKNSLQTVLAATN